MDKIYSFFKGIVVFFILMSTYVYFYKNYLIEKYYYNLLPKDRSWPTIDNVTGEIYNNWEVSDYVPLSNLCFYNMYNFTQGYGFLFGLLLFVVGLPLTFIRIKKREYVVLVFMLLILLGIVLIGETYD